MAFDKIDTGIEVFAKEGDVTVIEAETTDGTVSFKEGFPIAYSRSQDNGGKFVERGHINYLFKRLSSAIASLEESVNNMLSSDDAIKSGILPVIEAAIENMIQSDLDNSTTLAGILTKLTELEGAIQNNKSSLSLRPTTTEVDGKIATINTTLSNKSDLGHTHPISEIEDLNTASVSHADTADSATNATNATNADNATKADSVAWSGIVNKPEKYTPDTHTHNMDDVTSGTLPISRVTGLQTALDSKQASGSYAASNHNHDTVYSKTDHNHSGVYANASHSHDDRYFTETEINTKLAGYSTTSHNHDGAYLGKTAKASSATTADEAVKLKHNGWITNGADILTLAGGYYQLKPDSQPKQTIPTGFSTYGGITIIDNKGYSDIRLIDVYGQVAYWSQNKAQWIPYALKDHNHDSIYLGKTAKAASATVADSATNATNATNAVNSDKIDGSHAWEMQTLSSGGQTHGSGSWILTCRHNVDNDNFFKLICGDSGKSGLPVSTDWAVQAKKVMTTSHPYDHWMLFDWDGSAFLIRGWDNNSKDYRIARVASADSATKWNNKTMVIESSSHNSAYGSGYICFVK